MVKSKRILILYGSQTFTGQEISERIWRTTKILGLHGPVQAMDDYPISQLIKEEFTIFVCATTGQGDEPDNMKRFWRFLLRKSLPSNSLKKLKFGVLALGDSSYTKFNYVGKKLHKRLEQLGATPLVDVGLCDYQHDLGHDAVITPWLKKFWEILKIYYPDIQPNNIQNKFIPRWKVELIKDKELDIKKNCLSEDIYFKTHVKDFHFETVQLELTKNIRTTDESHFQDVRLISFKTVNDIKLNYRPGDVFNFRPRNSKEDIDEIFALFQTHNLDIKPHYQLLVKEYHEGE